MWLQRSVIYLICDLYIHSYGLHSRSCRLLWDPENHWLGSNLSKVSRLWRESTQSLVCLVSADWNCLGLVCSIKNVLHRTRCKATRLPPAWAVALDSLANYSGKRQRIFFTGLVGGFLPSYQERVGSITEIVWLCHAFPHVKQVHMEGGSGRVHPAFLPVGRVGFSRLPTHPQIMRCQHVFLGKWGNSELVVLGVPVVTSLWNFPSHILVFFHSSTLVNSG